ncbi:4-coumarate--CoA ligase family protein [Egibacter rhizosphaerae]|uniref:4-coumarate--CoA ligase family protein n=1 Tax=Egibacter rhizosphaerae TaxID=1670831 RepID=A0A411YFH1_9ACTN|nr:AMP-binding protein [Egibacter rhizosphaerae]QBI19862.1 4-coumarate--CoA ligase family protein [Egibacter rhizosphaerae]
MITRSIFPNVEIPDVTVPELVLGGVEGNGDAPAIVDGATNRVVSRSELARSAAGFATALRRLGIRPDDVVALHLPNGPAFAAAFHGVLLAGAIVTTVNPLYTAEELGHQLADSAAKVLVTADALLATAEPAASKAGDLTLVVVGEAPQGALAFDDLLATKPRLEEDPRDPHSALAVLPYSSGTTGLPKGVELTHRNLVANLCQSQPFLQIEPWDRVVAVLPFFHIYGMVVVLNLGLWQGARVVTLPRFDLAQFLGVIEQQRITRAFVVPPIALALAHDPSVDEHDLSSLRMVLSGAAPLSPEVAATIERRLGCGVAQGYGLTETSPVTHLSSLQPGGNRHDAVGLVVPNTEAAIRHPDGTMAGIGEEGELVVRGPQVMRGYLGRPDETANTIDDDGWLRTGDLAVRDEDGRFRIVDRLKELIKYKGFQVPPAELEALLLEHEGVADCAVVGVPDAEAGELPKAVVVAAGELDPEDLMAWVAERVAPHKRVRQVEFVDRIPKSASGKILRRELR